MRAGARHRRPLAIAFGLILGFLVVQVVTAVATGSLALLSDAGHMATDDRPTEVVQQLRGFFA